MTLSTYTASSTTAGPIRQGHSRSDLIVDRRRSAHPPAASNTESKQTNTTTRGTDIIRSPIILLQELCKCGCASPYYGYRPGGGCSKSA